MQQRVQNLEIIVNSSAQCSAAGATANHCWPGALLDAGEWCAPQTWETLQSELAEQQTPSHLRSETPAFNLVTQRIAARRIQRYWRVRKNTLAAGASTIDQAVIATGTVDEEIFDDLFATIREPSFRTELAAVFRGDVVSHHQARNQSSLDRLQLAAQEKLRARVEDSVVVSWFVSDFRYENDLEDLRSNSNAFCTIATFLPGYDPDVLGEHLRLSYRVASGCSFPQQHAEWAEKLDAELRRVDLTDLRDTAAVFYMAIGELQE